MKLLKGDKNQCQGCKEFFNSIKAFDMHRTGKHGVDRRCMIVEEMIDKGMSLNASDFWITEKKSKELLDKLNKETK
jgi:hypoxanthine-guanine phosphoribosyltransferase